MSVNHIHVTMKKNLILLLLGIFGVICSCYGGNIRNLLRKKRAEPDYILRSCISSAQLTRKHRTNDAAQISVENSNLSKLYPLPLVSDHLKNKNYNSNKYYRNNIRLHARSKGRHLFDKSTSDTPLGTIDVKAARKDIPKIFKKKEPLPELDRHGSARNLNGDAPIIIVQSLKH